jgi:hypothetical protein
MKEKRTKTKKKPQVELTIKVIGSQTYHGSRRLWFCIMSDGSRRLLNPRAYLAKNR